jgi:hypothetical protein
LGVGGSISRIDRPATSSSSTIDRKLGGSVGPLTGMRIVEAGKKPGMRLELYTSE